MFTSADNGTDLDIIDNEMSNGGVESSDDDAENSTDQRDNDEEKLDSYILEKLILDDNDDELTENHAGADEALVQLINMKKESRKYVRILIEKVYLSVHLSCAALLETAASATLDCEVILMSLLLMLRLITFLETSLPGLVSMTQQRAESVQH